MKKKREMRAKMTVDRKIVEGLREGQSLTKLSKTTQKGKGYVVKVKNMALEYGFIEPTVGTSKVYKVGPKAIPPYPEALFPLQDGRSEKLIETDEYLVSHKDWIIEKLQLSWSPQTIFEELPASIPRANFYRYLHRHNLMKRDLFKNIPEIITAPGESLQIDWGKLADVKIMGQRITLWMFIGTMGHSRYRMVRLVEKCNLPTTIIALMSMFEDLGGVPHKVTSDNPKVFVKEASQYEPILNPVYERFASHYNFTIEALPARTPQLKGKVERIVTPIRRLFESYNFENYSLDSAQEHINKKLVLHNERKHSVHQMKPINVFLEDEAKVLKPLPPQPYELENITYPTIRQDGYVCFDKKYYRVDPQLKGEDAIAIGNPDQVAIYCKGRLLECYDRIKDPFQTKACKEHLKEPWEKNLQDQGHYLKRAASIGADVERFINIILARGSGFIDTRVIWGILSFDKKYNNDDINQACATAIELSQISFQSVKKILQMMAQKKNEPSTDDSFTTQQGKFSRSMSEYKRHLNNQ
jgi:hypothetical protein